MNKKFILIIILIILLLLTLSLLILFIFKNREGVKDKNQYLLETPGLSREAWRRKLEIVKSKKDYKNITNRYDGYQITVPDSWFAQSTADSTGGLKMFFDTKLTTKDYEENLEVDADLMLTIQVFKNGQNYLLGDWIKHSNEAKGILPKFNKLRVFEYPKVLAYTASYVLMEEIYNETSGKLVETPRFDSLVQNFVFQKKQTVYLVTCLAVGDGFEKLSEQCAEQIPSFTILD